MKKTRWLLIFIMFLIFSSCTIYCNGPRGGLFHNPNITVKDILPRQSFVKLRKTTKIKFCNPDPEGLEQCVTKKIGSSASGFVVQNDEGGSYIVTAAHVCDDSELDNLAKTSPGVEIVDKRFELIDIEGKKFDIITLSYVKKHDICMTYSYGFYKPPVKISETAPVPGDVVYNLAAPIGIFDANMIPIMHGHYNGVSRDLALYSLPAAGGSSGSPIFNYKGELVGLIHSVYIRFPYISLSPPYKDLISFIYENTNKQKIIEKNILKGLYLPIF